MNKKMIMRCPHCDKEFNLVVGEKEEKELENGKVLFFKKLLRRRE